MNGMSKCGLSPASQSTAGLLMELALSLYGLSHGDLKGERLPTWSDTDPDVPRPGAGLPSHCLDCLLGDATDSPAPSDRHDSNRELNRVVEHNRRTVGYEDGDRGHRRAGNQRITGGHSRFSPVGPSTPVVWADGLYPDPVRLAGHNQIPKVETESVAHDLAVGHNASWVVPHFKTQVEACRLAAAHPAVTTRDRSQSLVATEAKPD